MTDKPMIYAAVYSDIGGALAALDTFERLHRRVRDRHYDGAVIDTDEGVPRIAKRVESPTIYAIPKLLRSGLLAKHPLYDAAEELRESEAAFVLVGDPDLEGYFDRATTRALMTGKRSFDTTTEMVVF